ncbi:uncharacterized protein LOC131172132 [Hevea brasiliensis]|uniref:uncharacterized protein LOC131172132 n=1 Tax=Hevea brasiliensis TaxID=3981 RepID=UPI0025D00382|nr:uncharacterized protein LOC131172132 [Hevea brasiliensis]
MVGEVEYEGQKIQWKKEKALSQSMVKEAGIQNGKLWEKLEYHEILMEEYKQENKRKKLELKDQAQLINDISKECAKERKEKDKQATLYQELRGNIDWLEKMIAQGKQELLLESEYALKMFNPAKQEETNIAPNKANPIEQSVIPRRVYLTRSRMKKIMEEQE